MHDTRVPSNQIQIFTFTPIRFASALGVWGDDEDESIVTSHEAWLRAPYQLYLCTSFQPKHNKRDKGKRSFNSTRGELVLLISIASQYNTPSVVWM
jgi:hypothetical protein